MRHRCPRCRFKWRDAELAGCQTDLNGNVVSVFRRADLLKWNDKQGNLQQWQRHSSAAATTLSCKPAPTDADAERLATIRQQNEMECDATE